MMTSHLHLFLMAIIASLTLGARIELNTLRKDVSPPLTMFMDLSCFLEEKEDPEPDESRIVSVTSIKITRGGGDDIAHVSQYKAAEILSAVDTNMKARGDVSRTGNLHGYLALVWDEPTREESGLYTCVIETKDEDDKEVTFRKSVSIAYRAPGLDEVVSEIVLMHKMLKFLPNYLPQKGNGTCAQSSSWSNGPTGSDLTNARYTTVTGQFKKAFYPKKPLFFVSVNTIDATSPVRVSVKPSKVTMADFEIECITWSGSAVEDVEFEWFAIAPPFDDADLFSLYE